MEGIIDDILGFRQAMMILALYNQLRYFSEKKLCFLTYFVKYKILIFTFAN